jgi:hypothetical protein
VVAVVVVVAATLIPLPQQVVQAQQVRAMLAEQVVLLETVMDLGVAGQVLLVLVQDQVVQVQESLTV